MNLLTQQKIFEESIMKMDHPKSFTVVKVKFKGILKTLCESLNKRIIKSSAYTPQKQKEVRMIVLTVHGKKRSSLM